jgi:hypothetical protein
MNRSLWLYSSSLFWGLALLALIQLARLWWYDPRRNTKSSVAKQLHFGVFVAAIGTRGVSYLFVARAVFFSWAHCFLIVSAVRATTTVLRNATDADRCDNVQTSFGTPHINPRPLRGYARCRSSHMMTTAVTIIPVPATEAPTRMNSFFASDMTESMLLDFAYGMFPTLTFFNVTSLILLFWAQVSTFSPIWPPLHQRRDSFRPICSASFVWGGLAQRYWETKMPLVYEEQEIGPFLNRVRIGPSLQFARVVLAVLLEQCAPADVARSQHGPVANRCNSCSNPCPEGCAMPGNLLFSRQAQ